MLIQAPPGPHFRRCIEIDLDGSIGKNRGADVAAIQVRLYAKDMGARYTLGSGRGPQDIERADQIDQNPP
jgi:hypothetical protein